MKNVKGSPVSPEPGSTRSLPYKVLNTPNASYLYLPYTSEFYKLKKSEVELIPVVIDGKQTKKTSPDQKKKLNLFLAKHPGVKQALEHYQSFSFKNPVITRGYRSALKGHISTCVLCMTEQCNMRCSYCCYSDHYPMSTGYKNNTMTFEIAKSAVTYFRNHSRETADKKSIGFYGGEPLINFPVIKKVVSFARKLFEGDIEFSMTTNATLLTDLIIRFLIKNKFRLTISLDGTEEMNDRFRKYRHKKQSVHRDIVEKVKRIRALNKNYFYKNVIFNTVISAPLSIKAIEEFFKKEVKTRAINVGLSEISDQDTNFFDNYPESLKYEEELDEARRSFYQKLINGIRDDKRQSISFYHYLRGAFIRIHKRARKPVDQMAPFPTGQCLPGIKQLYVMPLGDIQVCEKFDQQFNIGNVDTGIDIQKVIDLLTPFYNSSRKTCKTCWVQRICSICIPGVIKKGRFDSKSKREACINERSYFLRVLQEYLEVLEKNPESLDFLKKWTYG